MIWFDFCGFSDFDIRLVGGWAAEYGGGLAIARYKKKTNKPKWKSGENNRLVVRCFEIRVSYFEELKDVPYSLRPVKIDGANGV